MISISKISIQQSLKNRYSSSKFFMLRKLAKAVGFYHKTQMPISLNKYGNTSSVSIPLTICSELQEGVDHILGIGMGAGLSTGIMDINIGGVKNYGVFEGDL